MHYGMTTLELNSYIDIPTHCHMTHMNENRKSFQKLFEVYSVCTHLTQSCLKYILSTYAHLINHRLKTLVMMLEYCYDRINNDVTTNKLPISNSLEGGLSPHSSLYFLYCLSPTVA